MFIDGIIDLFSTGKPKHTWRRRFIERPFSELELKAIEKMKLERKVRDEASRSCEVFDTAPDFTDPFAYDLTVLPEDSWD